MSTGMNLPPDPQQPDDGAGWSGSQVVRDSGGPVGSDTVKDPSETGWSGDQVVRDQQAERPADEETGWTGDQVARDQDVRPDEDTEGWDPGNVVTDR